MSGAYNRGYLERCLHDQFELANHDGTALSVAVCDIDDFQRVRDRVGPEADGHVLRVTGTLLAGCVRRLDTVARYDADAFAVLLPQADEAMAREVCQRIVIASQTTRHAINAESLSITLSVGFATHHPGHRFQSAEALVSAAHQALHKAKLQGANQMVVYEPGRPAPRVAFL